MAIGFTWDWKYRLINGYRWLKKILFRLNPETAHALTLNGLALLEKLKLTKLLPLPAAESHEVMGLSFPNRIGLAAGMDKNGDYIDALAALGFGFIEVGTVTPKPQHGNPRPRLFRLPEQEAIINRMGFNNKGVDYLVQRLQQTKFKGVLGVNLGKGRDTPIEHAADDYLYGLHQVWPYASYVTINISSPNTENLRQLQQIDLLRDLLRALKSAQALYSQQSGKYVPLVVKIAPDLAAEQVTQMAELFLAEKIDAVIATNTTLSRDGVEGSVWAQESGGLSGKPLFTPSTTIVQQLHSVLADKIPIIACGGIMTVEDAQAKFAAGASLLQIYSGLIYRGPGLIRELRKI
jgi:dihydroorotate dehydrogenase